MDNNNIQDAKSFASTLAIAQKLKINIVEARDGVSRLITFHNEGFRFKNMMKAAETDHRERGGFLYLDTKKAEVGLSGILKGTGNMEMSLPNRTGGHFGKDGEKLILGTIHTHQAESEYRKKGFSDKELFDSQYRNPDSDGQMAKSAKDNRYTIGTENVNYYSPDGKTHSSNNAGSRQDLESGKYNIGKEALQNYGKQP